MEVIYSYEIQPIDIVVILVVSQSVSHIDLSDSGS